jgi:hypothetical protein
VGIFSLNEKVEESIKESKEHLPRMDWTRVPKQAKTCKVKRQKRYGKTEEKMERFIREFGAG